MRFPAPIADRFKFGPRLWHLAAIAVCALEVYAATGRLATTAGPVEDPPAAAANAGPCPPRPLAIGTLHGSPRQAAVLVVGNPTPPGAGDLEIVLTARQVPLPTTGASTHQQAATPGLRYQQAERLAERNQHAGTLASHSTSVSACESPVPGAGIAEQTERVFFLPRSIAAAPADNIAIGCLPAAGNSRIRVYIDRRLAANESCNGLAAAVVAAADRLGNVIDDLVGRVSDIDRDGRLAVVLTPEVARLSRGQTPVDGLTRPGDFRPDVDRPMGNGADVIFLNSSLTPGPHLQAVLAHEWCHAAVFGRRRGDHALDDDWLNEAVAHAVEVRASGSATNVSHRIDSYLSRPSDSPLVVRDYCRPEFWRHNGCRGAAYLFLDWCLAADERLLRRLTAADSLGVEGLEAATGRPFEELFQGWTISLGQDLALHLARHQSARQTVQLESPCWRLEGGDPQSRTIRLRGTTAQFLQLDVTGTWELSARILTGEGLQATIIPIPAESAVP